MDKIVTITHSADGCVIAWPDGSYRTFANAVRLAEYTASLMCQCEDAKDIVNNDVCMHLNTLRQLSKREDTLPRDFCVVLENAVEQLTEGLTAVLDAMPTTP